MIGGIKLSSFINCQIKLFPLYSNVRNHSNSIVHVIQVMILINLIIFILPIFYYCHGNPITFLGQTPFQCYIPSSQDIGLFLYQLYAVESSSLEPVSVEYSIVSGNDLGLFVINSTNGIIHSAFPLGVSDHTLAIQADSSGNTTTASLSIHIIPSLHQSLFEHTRYNLSIAEDIRVGTRISIIRVFSSVQATVSLGGDSQGDFMLNPLNGHLSVARPLDREAIPVYHINLLVQDGSDSQDNVAILVVMVTDVNDETPVFHRSFYNVTVDDGTLPNSTVAMVMAMDRDEGSNGRLVYSLSGDANVMASFYVHATTGIVYNSITLDYEVRRQHQFTITATDQGDMPRSSYASVLVTLRNLDDTCPQFSSSLYEIEQTSTELEILNVPRRLLWVEAFDPDNISRVEYAIQSGNDENVFQINSTIGVITLLRSDIRGQFELNVSASDGCFTFTMVTVSLGDVVNEHHPEFISSCQAELRENATIGTHVITVVAIDDDTGRFGRLTYSFLTETSLFAINESSGEIVTTAIPESYDRESVPGFELGVLATDGGGLQGFCEMWISLIDINDNPPLFIVTAYSVSIRPSFSIGQFVVQVQANDRDTGIHGNISYSIDDPVPFAIDANGIITVSQMLISQNYSFHVFARNQGTPLLSSSVPVMITMPTGEIPVFTGCTYNISMGTDQICVYSVTIPESIRDDIGIIVATNVSRDSTVVVVYEALRGRDYRSNGERTLYVASSGSIQVNTSSVLDYERLSPGPYVMQFLVSAHVLPNHTFAVAMVIINVTDVDDSPPRFPAVTLFATVTENVGINARVTMATAHDPDSGLFGRVTHSIRGEQTDFAISPSNGIVTSLRSFDAEMESDFTLIVRAVSNGKEDFASLVISVGDINDNAPFFSQSVYNISVRENEPVFSKLFHFPITDLDQSDRGRHIYSIVGGNNDGTFSITRSGDLILQQLLDYDRSSRRSYFLSVHVSDGMFSDEAYVNIQIIDVDDEPPIFTPDTYSVVLSEAVAEGTFVVQLIAVDIDSDTITYRLTGLADGRLAVTTNGTVLVSGELDREFLPQLWFFAFAIGEEGCIAVATVTITLTDVNDNAPIWLHPFIVAVIQENVAGPTLITTVLATDPDEGHSGTVTYHLMDNFDRFLINATSGELTAIVAFDREQIQLLSVMVTARDNGTPQLSSQVEVLIEILDVNDNPPFFPYPYMFARVCEDAPVGQNVLFIPAADRDTGSNAAVQFILESGGTDDGRFKVNISTGEVTLAQRIDFENITHHLATLHISLVDLGIPTHRSVSMATLEIELLDSNDNQPIPSESSHVVSLAEDIPIGRVVLTLTSTDRDSGSNAELTYSITCCIDSVFSVITEGNNGLLTVASTLDYETISVHQLEIVVSDNGRPPLHSSISVSINVSDVNDNPPQFSQSVYSVSVPENITSVVELIQVSASDPDTGLGGVIDTYAILTGNEEGYFTINEATGFVGLQGAEFDRETVDQYVLTVTATDQGNPQQLTGSALLLVTISDVDDNPSYSGYMTIFINSLDGRFQAGYLGDVYLNDSDSSSILERCVGTSGDQDLLGVADNCSLILQEDDPGEGLYELIVNGTSGDVSVTTTVMVTVKHIATPSSFLALTLGVNVETYLLSHYTSFPILLAELVGVSKVDIISITPSDGEESVDIVFTGETLPPVSHIIQQLFLQRDIFTANDIPLVTIPIDVCQDNYCLNLGRCISRSTVTNGRVPTVMSTFVYYSVHVIYKRSCDCGYWATGNRCETVFDHCYSNPCNNGGVCKNVILDFECDCPDSTTGKQCNDDCSNRECLNGGVCVSDLAASSYCSCPEGYYGDKCQYQYFVDSNYCIPSPCQNGATCSAGRDGFTCHCPRGYSGSLCEQSVVREGGCVSNPCYHNSTCIVNATNGFVCACSVGFTGPQCRWPLNECETKPCGSDVNACLPGRYGSYLCRCGHGYTGPNCSLPDFCDPNPCRNGGTCDLVADGYRCQCNANYIGMNCEDLIADCMDNMCMHNSSCRDNGLTCDCPLFAAGRYCEVFCPHGNTGEMCEQEINFCQSNSSICLNGGTCLNTKAGATCDCPPTQFGDRCEMNCSDENCANDGTCTSDLGVCQCDDGFDGPQCKLTTISFRASPGQPTYRAYDTLQFRTLGVISFQVRKSFSLFLVTVHITVCLAHPHAPTHAHTHTPRTTHTHTHTGSNQLPGKEEF